MLRVLSVMVVGALAFGSFKALSTVWALWDTAAIFGNWSGVVFWLVWGASVLVCGLVVVFLVRLLSNALSEMFGVDL